MTNPTNPRQTDEDRELIERLISEVVIDPSSGLACLINPAGPKAADRLESLLSDKAKLEERVREIGASVRSAALDALRQFPEAEEAIFPAVASATYAALNNKSGQ